MYNILDFEAVTKHSYFGQKGRTSDTVMCETTGEEVVSWMAAVNDFLVRYMGDIEVAHTLLTAHDMGTDYRSAFFPDYKKKTPAEDAKRSPEERNQLKLAQGWVKKFLAAIGATQIGVKGVEADDVIAYLCQGQGVSAVVHTVDADLLQLCSDSVAVFLKGEAYTGGMEHNGIPVEITSFSKAVLGDPSDKYKGVPGIGPKGFMQLLEGLEVEGVKYLESLVQENNLTAAEQLASEHPDNKVLAKLVDNWPTLLDQYRLARLHPELCWKPRARKLVKPIFHKRVPNGQQVYDLLKEVGAEDLWKTKYSTWVPGFLLVTGSNYPQLKDVIKKNIEEGCIVAYDYESTDINQFQRFRRAGGADFVDTLSQKITGISLCFGKHHQNVIYVTVDHKDSDNVDVSVVGELLTMVKEANKTPVAHNAFFEGVLTRTNLNMVFGGVQDTRMLQRYADENSSAGLKSMSAELLNYHQESYEQTVALAGFEGATMRDLTADQAFKYGADDSLVTAHLYHLLVLKMQLSHQWFHYLNFAVESTQTLQSAFIKGVKINWKLQKELQEADEATIVESIEKLRKILEENVTGEITEGCKSLIEAESKFQEKSLRRKDEDTWYSNFMNWKGRLEEACIYQPYSEEVVPPSFSFTAKQLTEVTNLLSLPPVEKTSLTFLREYFDELNLTSLEPTEYGGDAGKFLDLLQNAVTHRVDKLSKEPTIERQKAFDDLAEFCIKTTGKEGKVVKVGDELSITSPAQMQRLIYCKIGVPVRNFGTLNKSRIDLGIFQAAPSTDEGAIQTALVMDAKGWQVDALKLLLAAKSASTRISLFHNKMPLWVHDDGRIHPYILDSGTATRRPTGSAPNVLQIPSKGEGRNMRRMYVPPSPDYVCVAIDFSGQELRILACESQDPNMLAAYRPGQEKDIHSMTAVTIVKKLLERGNEGYAPITEFEAFEAARKNDDHPLHKLADHVRGDMAKPCNFGLTYGAEPPTIARNLIIALEEAEMMFEGTLQTFQRLRPWQEEQAAFMTENGFTLTAFGTRRHATDALFSKSRGEVSRMHRQGTNATIQGTAAEALKYILTTLHTEGWLYSLRFDFFAPIYDEVVSWVHKDDVVEYCKQMGRIMTEATPPTHEIPQVPEFSIGCNWGECHELGANPTEEQIIEITNRALAEGAEAWATDLQLSYEDVYGCPPEEYGL